MQNRERGALAFYCVTKGKGWHLQQMLLEPVGQVVSDFQREHFSVLLLHCQLQLVGQQRRLSPYRH